MKLPFLLNSVSRCNSLKHVEEVFTKLLKVLPSLDGNTVSHCLNILSKKEVNHPKLYWSKTADLLTQISETLNYNTILSNYEVKHVCIILNSFAKVGHLSLNLIETSTNIIIKQIRDVHTRDVCNVIHSLGKLNQINPLTRILNRLFKLRRNEEQDFEKILSVIERSNEQDFSMLLRVFLLNSENLKLDSITRKLLKSISDKYDDLSDQTLAILSNSLANYGKDDSQTLSVLAPIITFRLRKGYFTQQCVAQISNGYAKLNRRDLELFTAISDRVLNDITQFTPRCLSNVLNAFSKLSIYKGELFMASIAHLEQSMDSMTPQCIGNIISSYSKFIRKFELPIIISFFNKLITTILKVNDFDSFIGQNYANILNGVSKAYLMSRSAGNLKDPNIDVQDLVGGGVMGSANCDAKKSDINSTVNSETEQLKVFELFNKVCDPIIKIEDDLNYLDVLLISNSMARCRVLDHQLLTKLLIKLKLFHKKYKTLEVVNIINTLSILYQCIVNKNYRSIYNEELGGTDTINFEQAQSRDDLIKEKIMTHYLYFVDYLFENLCFFKNLRPLDVKLLFNSFGRCNVTKKEYCDVLVDKYINLFQNKITNMVPIVNHYVNCNMQVPIQLKEYITQHANRNDQKYDKQLSVTNLVNGVSDQLQV